MYNNMGHIRFNANKQQLQTPKYYICPSQHLLCTVSLGWYTTHGLGQLFVSSCCFENWLVAQWFIAFEFLGSLHSLKKKVCTPKNPTGSPKIIKNTLLH